MKVNKYTTYDNITYYECQPIEGICLFSFTLRQLVLDLILVYGYAVFRPLNLN